MLFLDDYQDKTPEQMQLLLKDKVMQARIPAVVVTMGDRGAVYADAVVTAAAALPAGCR